jgi:tRNA threonylcarbamoyladenosine biosynthesis protein TsaB
MTRKQFLLAVDTSTRITGLAIYDGDQVLNENVWLSGEHQTVELAPALVDVLARSHVQIDDIGALAIALGPGSFTGLRIGLALVKGIALVLRVPLIGIPSLDALAAAQLQMDVPMAAVLRAGRGRLAVGWYHLVTNEQGEHEWQSDHPLEVITPVELSQRIVSPTLICGEITEAERRVLGRKWKKAMLASPAASLRRPSFLAELAWKRWIKGQVDDPETLSPIYLHYSGNTIGEPVPG